MAVCVCVCVCVTAVLAVLSAVMTCVPDGCIVRPAVVHLSACCHPALYMHAIQRSQTIRKQNS